MAKEYGSEEGKIKQSKIKESQKEDIIEVKKISSAVIRRLPRYYRYLQDLRSEGVMRISSEELSRRMHVTASQIRQDLNNFGGFGQQGYGYNVEHLKTEIGRILGLDHSHDMVLIGAGNLGRALAGYTNFANRGFVVKAIFDEDPEIIGKQICGLTVLPAEDLEDYLSENTVDIAVLAIPKMAAQKTADRLVACGLRAIWNFAPLDLNVPKGVSVENVNLIESLMLLSYRLGKDV